MVTPAERVRALFPGGSLGEYDLPPDLTVGDADLARFLERARAAIREDTR